MNYLPEFKTIKYYDDYIFCESVFIEYTAFRLSFPEVAVQKTA